MKYKLRQDYTTNPRLALREVLISRGVKDIENFLNPSGYCEINPYYLNNIREGANLLLEHLRKNSSILFVVDADCDGFTSSAILWLYIKHLFPEADLNFTLHEHKQHGLNDKIDEIEDENLYDLVICPDAASYDINEHKRLAAMGISCLILDHHEQLYDNEGCPIRSNEKNVIIINNQLSEQYENKSLCGAGVVFKFCEVLDDILGIQQANTYLDLVALGEIADVMDRTTVETNYLMLKGLSNINNKGFQTLLASQSYSLKEKAVYPWKGLTPIDVAFYIAPLINAITRIGTRAEKEAMFYCFIEPDRPLHSTKRGAGPHDIELAADQAARVGKNAKSRQDKLKEKAMDLIDFKIQKNDLLKNNIILIELDEYDDIPQEMTGLIAMAVVSKYHKPCMIGRRNSNNEIQGSIRNDGNFAGLPSFKKFLEESNFITYAAGHDNACGFGINAKQIDNFINYSNTKLSAADFENCYTVDYILDGRNNNNELLYALAAHPEYFGNHIDEIKIVIKNISLANISIMGANKDSIKINFNGVDYVHFKDTDFIEQVMNNRTKTLTIYGRLNINEWMGHQSIQCFIDDYDFEIDNSKYEF